MEGTQDKVVYWATGRRKSAIARVRLVPGEGQRTWWWSNRSS